MNHNVSQTNLIFVDRPMTEETRHLRASVPQSLYCQDATDYSEVAMRVFLVICLLASLVVCGWEMSGPAQTRPASTQAVTKIVPVCIGAALPAAPFVSSLR